MKKLVALLLALVLCLSLCACGAKTEAETVGDPRDASVVFDNSSEVVDVTKLDSAKLAEAKVGLIFLHDENSTYDLNFMDAAIEACESLGVEYVVKTNVPEGSECYDTAAELADAGCTIIFADSFGHEDYMIQAAKEFPDVQFCHATGTKAHNAGLANYHNAFATIYEGRYLGGVAAGMKLNEMIENGEITAEEAKIGYVGAFTYAEVISGYTSFFLGARSVCPSATMEVTFTGSWYDETLEREGALKLIDNDCVLISLHADSMGAPTACQAAGVPFVFYNGACVEACPDTFIVSTRINWVAFMTTMIGKIAMGDRLSADWTGTLENGAVDLSEINEKAAAAGTAEKIEEVKAEIISGQRHVFDITTFTVDGKQVDSYLANLNDWSDGKSDGDTEIISDGAFCESKDRSAPAFDFQIDGITLLDTAF